MVQGQGILRGMKIGEAARRAGVQVDTVRFYERRGLLPRPARRASGYRDLSEAAVERIALVKRLQRVGLTLGEIGEVLRDVDTGKASCAGERPRFDAVLARIDGEIAALRAVRRGLARTLAGCGSGSCPLPARRTG